MSKNEETAENFEDYEGLKNTLPKDLIISHIEKLVPALATMQSYDIFTGEDVTAGQYQDGDFLFPTDFLHYFRKYDIGIPYEYEKYLKEVMKDGVA